ncbi:MAG: fumarate hydratase [Alphaproteobacteria bacterium]|nr:fumarate hydratase [Alphaproteobacteria bacterium]
MTHIKQRDLVESIYRAFQFVSYNHSVDFVKAMSAAYEQEKSVAAKMAIGQILVNSRMCAIGQRPICQDTGIANVFMKIGLGVTWELQGSLQDAVDEGVRQAFTDKLNPLRASVIEDPLFSRRNTGDNSPAMLHVELVPGDKVEIFCSAKGGGSENKAKFMVLNPSDNVADWVVEQMKTLGAGWCPPGYLGIGVGGSSDKAMLLAKKALSEPLNMLEIQARGPQNNIEELRLEIFQRVNALGIGAQGLGGMTSVLDVKIQHLPTHAASMPVAMIPNCAATRQVSFVLDGSGPAYFDVPERNHYPNIVLDHTDAKSKKIDLDNLDHDILAGLQPGDTLLITGHLYTGRDAAHKRMVETLNSGQALPVNLQDKAIYYVGPVNPVGDEVIGPAGPTTSTRMDKFTRDMLKDAGLKIMIGKAERGPEAIAAIREFNALYLIAIGGAAYLVSKAIKTARCVAYEDLGMEAIYEFYVEDMPVMVGVNQAGESIHQLGPAAWSR